MRPQTPLDVCAQIARRHAAGTLAAIDKTPAAKLAKRLEHYGETLSELAAELAGDRVSDSDEDASEKDADGRAAQASEATVRNCRDALTRASARE